MAVARSLRRDGMSIKSIAREIGCAQSSVSNWCQGIELTEQQRARLDRAASLKNQEPRDTQWRRRLEVETIEKAARESAEQLVASPFWAAGVALYWGEGAKTERRLSMTNADVEVLRLFIEWTQKFHGLNEFSGSVNLHADNDEQRARCYWSRELGIPHGNFTKSYIKPDGTGHRRNHLEHGVARVTARRSADAWITTMAWIGAMPEHLKPYVR